MLVSLTSFVHQHLDRQHFEFKTRLSKFKLLLWIKEELGDDAPVAEAEALMMMTTTMMLAKSKSMVVVQNQ